MSRIGKRIVEIPAGTELKLEDGVLTVKGKNGELTKKFNGEVVAIKIDGSQVTFEPLRNSGDVRALWGTYASHVINMIAGVNEPFVKKLILEGVGYKSDVQGKNLNLALGFSHPVSVEIPEGLTVTAEKNLITITGTDKEKVGSFAAEVRALKKPEPYKGKGFRYEDEVIRRKEGKKSV